MVLAKSTIFHIFQNELLTLFSYRAHTQHKLHVLLAYTYVSRYYGYFCLPALYLCISASLPALPSSSSSSPLLLLSLSSLFYNYLPSVVSIFLEKCTVPMSVPEVCLRVCICVISVADIQTCIGLLTNENCDSRCDDGIA